MLFDVEHEFAIDEIKTETQHVLAWGFGDGEEWKLHRDLSEESGTVGHEFCSPLIDGLDSFGIRWPIAAFRVRLSLEQTSLRSAQSVYAFDARHEHQFNHSFLIKHRQSFKAHLSIGRQERGLGVVSIGVLDRLQRTRLALQKRERRMRGM